MKSETTKTLIGKLRKFAKDGGERRVSLDCGGLNTALDRIQEAHDRELADCKKPKRNCDLYETYDEAQEAYEKLFYGQFKLKNCKDTIVALIPGSPEFNKWLMSPIEPKDQKRLDEAKAEKDKELKTVADVVRVMTGVGNSRGYYFNSEVREFGQKIRELHKKEIDGLEKRLDVVKKIAKRENWRDYKDQGVRVNTCAKVHNVVMKDILRAANGEKVNA